MDRLRTSLENKMDEYREALDNEENPKRRDAMETEISLLEDAQSNLESIVSDLDGAEI